MAPGELVFNFTRCLFTQVGSVARDQTLHNVHLERVPSDHLLRLERDNLHSLTWYYQSIFLAPRLKIVCLRLNFNFRQAE